MNCRDKVLQHLERYRVKRISEFGTEKGEYGKRYYFHILPKNDADKNIIDRGYQNDILGLLKSENIKRHYGFANLNSSQAMTLNLFGPLCVERILSTVIPHIQDQVQSEALVYQFEKKEMDFSEIDFYVESGDKKFYFEVKFTEKTIGTKSQSQHNDERWNIYYKEPMRIILKDEYRPYARNIFFDKYQLWRNVRMASDPDSFVYFVFPRFRRDLTIEVEASKQFLLPGFADKVKVLYVEDVCNTILSEYLDNCKLMAHYTEFYEKYISGID